MNPRKAFILVEGQTEEGFVKKILQPAMPGGLHLLPVIIATKRINSGGKFKGGVPHYRKVRAEVVRLLNDSSAMMVTTMLDYYALPETFPGRANPVGRTSPAKVDHGEQAWQADIGSPRFSAYLSLHEFVALLFSAPQKIAEGFARPELAAQLHAIRSGFPTPEDINDHPDTAPSVRLKKLYPRYSKPFFGSLIAGRIGIERMCAECAHFARWVAFLKSL
jgi:hypothetical protein